MQRMRNPPKLRAPTMFENLLRPRRTLSEAILLRQRNQTSEALLGFHRQPSKVLLTHPCTTDSRGTTHLAKIPPLAQLQPDTKFQLNRQFHERLGEVLHHHIQPQNTLDRTDDSLSSSQFPMRPGKPRNQASEDPTPPSRGSSFSSRGSGVVPSVATTLTASSGVSNSPSPRTGSPLRQSDDPVQSVPVPSVSGRINHFENFGMIMGKGK